MANRFPLILYDETHAVHFARRMNALEVVDQGSVPKAAYSSIDHYAVTVGTAAAVEL
jgi:hypothetical protein